MTASPFPVVPQMSFTTPSVSTPATPSKAQTAMAASGVPSITLNGTLYEVLYGYERHCGRSVLAMMRPGVDHEWSPVFGEVVGAGVLWHDGGPTEEFNTAMCAARPGEMVTYDVVDDSDGCVEVSQRTRRRLSEDEMASLVGVDYRLPTGGPICPEIRREWGYEVPGPVHECDTCGWR